MVKTIGLVAAGAMGGVVVGAATIPLAAVGLIFGVPAYFILQLTAGPTEPPPSVVSGHVLISKVEKVCFAV